MNNLQRKKLILEKLTRTFSPQTLDVIDDSEEHVGHTGAAGGAAHFTLIIDRKCFNGLPTVQIHRAIYQALAGMIPTEIHALKITLI